MKSSGPVAVFLAIASISRPCFSFFDFPLTWFDLGPIFDKANLQKMGFTFEDHKPPKISRGINGGIVQGDTSGFSQGFVSFKIKIAF